MFLFRERNDQGVKGKNDFLTDHAIWNRKSEPKLNRQERTLFHNFEGQEKSFTGI